MQSLAASRDLINAAISRTNAAVASHLLSSAHGGLPAAAAVHQQQQLNQPQATGPESGKFNIYF
jgi:hypothetical protein